MSVLHGSLVGNRQQRWRGVELARRPRWRSCPPLAATGLRMPCSFTLSLLSFVFVSFPEVGSHPLARSHFRPKKEHKQTRNEAPEQARMEGGVRRGEWRAPTRWPTAPNCACTLAASSWPRDRGRGGEAERKRGSGCGGAPPRGTPPPTCCASVPSSRPVVSALSLA